VYTNTDNQTKGLIERISTAVRILSKDNYINTSEVVVVNAAKQPDLIAFIMKGIVIKQYPIIYIGNERLGTFEDLQKAQQNGKLKNLLAPERGNDMLCSSLLISGDFRFDDKSEKRSYDDMMRWRADYDFTGETAQQISFKTGDIIYVHTGVAGVPPAPGWWWGEKKGEEGADKVRYFPSNYGKVIKAGRIPHVVRPTIYGESGGVATSTIPGDEGEGEGEGDNRPPPGYVDMWVDGSEWLLKGVANGIWNALEYLKGEDDDEEEKEVQKKDGKKEVDDGSWKEFDVVRTNWMWRRQERIIRLKKKEMERMFITKDVRGVFQYEDLLELVVGGKTEIILKFKVEKKLEDQYLSFKNEKERNEFVKCINERNNNKHKVTVTN